MPWRNWNNDEDLLRELGEALHQQRVVDAARDVARYRADLDQAVAALLYDSWLDTAAGVRAPVAGGPRSLVFTLGELRVEIELSDAGIEGQLVPPEPGRVRLLGAGGVLAETVADDVGCFTLPAARRGPIRLECAVAGRRLATEWITA